MTLPDIIAALRRAQRNGPGDLFQVSGFVAGQVADTLEQHASKLERWEQVWTALNDMGAQLGDANKPLAVTASWALMQRENAELQSKLNEMQHSFELRWQASQRAIKKWHAAGGPALVWPDHADLCVWLLEQLAERDSRLGECERLLARDTARV